MQKILLLAFSLFLFNCSSTETSYRLKHYTSDIYSFNYPKTWKTYKRNSSFRISPKFYLTPEAGKNDNFISFYTLSIDEKKPITIEELVKSDIDVITAHTSKEDSIKFSSEWVDRKKGKLFVLKVDNKSSEMPFEYLQYYYKDSGIIGVLRYHVRQEGVNLYKQDAIKILNSFKFID